jgi:hypothetical protein
MPDNLLDVRRNFPTFPSFRVSTRPNRTVLAGGLDTVDPLAGNILRNVNELVGKPVFDQEGNVSFKSAKTPPAPANPDIEKPEKGPTPSEAPRAARQAAPAVGFEEKTLEEVLGQPFEAILRDFARAEAAPYTLSDIIQRRHNTALFTEVRAQIASQRPSFNAVRVLEGSNMPELLFGIAAYGNAFEEPESIVAFMLDEVEDGGSKMVYDYVVARAVALVTEADKIIVEPADRTAIIQRLQRETVPFSEGEFHERVREAIRTVVFTKSELAIVNQFAKDLGITLQPGEISALINVIKHSNGAITTSNARFLLSPILTQLRTGNQTISTAEDTSALTEADFAVKYYEEDRATLEINRENILCAAQLYYVMTLGDELELFNVANQLISRYLPAGLVDIRSRETLQHLQLYMFSDSFRDPKNAGILYKRTQPEERQMLYKQVFSAGDANILEGMAVNNDFMTHWETLMTEVVKYLDKAEKSENPQFFISRQNIMQAVEDVQYNLSTFCTGMAKIGAPVISRELDFVVEKFLQSPEIIRQLAPNGSGSFWKVVERVLRDLRGEIPNVTALRNKATLGHMILSRVADYTPAMFEDDAKFSEFISLVEAYIIANSQLEMSASRLGAGSDEEMPGYGGSPDYNSNGNGSMPKDDWNF